MSGTADTGTESGEATLDTVSGHRDGFATVCPGEALYAEPDEMARVAAPTADFDGDGLTGLVAGTPLDTVGGAAAAGSVHILPGGIAGPVGAARASPAPATSGVRTSSEADKRLVRPVVSENRAAVQGICRHRFRGRG